MNHNKQLHKKNEHARRLVQQRTLNGFDLTRRKFRKCQAHRLTISYAHDLCMIYPMKENVTSSTMFTATDGLRGKTRSDDERTNAISGNVYILLQSQSSQSTCRGLQSYPTLLPHFLCDLLCTLHLRHKSYRCAGIRRQPPFQTPTLISLFQCLSI